MNGILKSSSRFYSKKDYAIVSLEKIQDFIDQGRFKPRENDFITMRDLIWAGILNNVQDGVKLLGVNN
jgi:hypothetical protein